MQQGLFAIQAPGIACERTIGTHHTVARHDHAPWVAANGGTYGTHRFEIAHFFGDIAIGDGVAVVNALQRLPHATLKRGSPSSR